MTTLPLVSGAGVASLVDPPITGSVAGGGCRGEGATGGATALLSTRVSARARGWPARGRGGGGGGGGRRTTRREPDAPALGADDVVGGGLSGGVALVGDAHGRSARRILFVVDGQRRRERARDQTLSVGRSPESFAGRIPDHDHGVQRAVVSGNGQGQVRVLGIHVCVRR